ncbi:MAG: protein phosphatase 2C domain-containing protein [Myxococcota bacterium]
MNTRLNPLLATLRAALPDRDEALTVAHNLPQPLDPVVKAYLREHMGFWRPTVHVALDVGPVRQHQEDGVFVSEAGRAYVAIDGMGGQSSGEFATRLMIEEMEESFPWPTQGEAHEEPDTCPMYAAFVRSNTRIFSFQRSYPAGYGTTAAGLWVDDWHMNVVHVGDCRVYRLRQAQLELLTRDHSLVNAYQDLKARGELPDSITEAQLQQYQNIITQAIGMKEELITPGWSRHPIKEGDRVLLCSDGLWRAVPQEKLEAMLNSAAPNLAQALVDAAVEANTQDNAAAVVVIF